MPILKALRAAAQTLSNHAMRADAMDALVLVRKARRWPGAGRALPGLLSMFARLGEQTGQLPADAAACRHSCPPKRNAAPWRWPPCWSRALIVAMGGMVMLIVLAVLLPIIQLNQWVK